jgi:hypothetical protein
VVRRVFRTTERLSWDDVVGFDAVDTGKVSSIALCVGVRRSTGRVEPVIGATSYSRRTVESWCAELSAQRAPAAD